MALRDYMRKTGFTRTVVPVSGGIDSALALAIAVDALGAGQVRAYNLPSRIQHRGDPLDRRAAVAPRSASTTASSRSPASTIDVRRHLRSARPSDRAQPHAREPARAHPRPADDGRVERHRRAADLLRQRDRDRARLRHALRRHVRRHLADRRSVEDRRLPAGALRQPRGTAARSSRRRPSRSSRRPSSPPTSSTRSTTTWSRRSSASWSSAAAARRS